MNKKSQATMEFLMTYGWAILVVLICLCVLIYIGFDYKPNKCYCNYVDMDNLNRMTINDTVYIECMNITKYSDYEKEKISFNTTFKLFFCSENKTLIPIK